MFVLGHGCSRTSNSDICSETFLIRLTITPLRIVRTPGKSKQFHFTAIAYNLLALIYVARIA